MSGVWCMVYGVCSVYPVHAERLQNIDGLEGAAPPVLVSGTKVKMTKMTKRANE